MSQKAKCPFCDAVLRVRYNATEGQFVYTHHLNGAGEPCAGAFSFVPPGALLEEKDHA